MTETESNLPQPERLIPLSIPVPNSLEQALGYDREGRYLSIWWEPAGDEAMWYAGRRSTTAYFPGFLAYTQHPNSF